MDFIGPLPRTARGHDVILVVVDKLTRWVYYIPARQTASAQETFALLDRFVLANHDTPKQIVSDRDALHFSLLGGSVVGHAHAAQA